MSQPKEVTVSWLNNIAQRLKREPSLVTEGIILGQWETQSLKALLDTANKYSKKAEDARMKDLAVWLTIMEKYSVDQIADMVKYFEREE